MKVVRFPASFLAPRSRRVAAAPRVAQAEEIEVVDAILVSEDPRPNDVQHQLKERIDVHRIVGTVVAATVLGMLLLFVTAVGAIGIMGMFGILLAEPLN